MYTVHIRKNETGEIRKYSNEGHGEWGENSDYIWVDGNYSCDCNRALFFARAGDENEEKAWQQECGETEYAVLFVVLPSGEKIIIDDIGE